MKSKLRNLQKLESVLSQDPKAVATTIARIEKEIIKKGSFKNMESVVEEFFDRDGKLATEKPIFGPGVSTSSISLRIKLIL